MFQQRPRYRRGLSSFLTIFELVYHSIVRDVRKMHGNAVIALGLNMLQVIFFVLSFYLLFNLLGMRRAAIRGDFMLYIMSGIFLFLTHTKTMGAVSGSEGPSSAMMKHAPMTTFVSILSAAFGALYIQLLSLFLCLFIYDVLIAPVVIIDMAGAFMMRLLAWFTGVGVGMVVLALTPWFPNFVMMFKTLYQRANMIASGKMFVANSLPPFMLNMFDWNPLFHCIDQARGYVFINYFPRNSNWEYPLWVGLVLLMIGLMGEFYTRRHASLSWQARR